MSKAYDHKKIEKKWQDIWEKEQAFATPDDSKKEKAYVLDMFPYPSGAGIHLGHVENYTGTDIYSRFKRMQGYSVLHPMGWDAFGLPAENYAIKSGVPPQKTTDDAIENFRKQIKGLGLSYDWSREIGTHTPGYYKWTQWFFLFLYKNGLAEKRMAKVNWCPKDQTVLANEQTISETGEKGVCVRCGTKVIQKDLEQWFFKITDFANALVDDLDQVDWPESTKINQRNWIGRSEGAEIDFPVAGSDEKIRVFTTRPDTLFGATYMVLAPEHPEISNLKLQITNWDEVSRYIEAAAHKTELERQEGEKEKTGVEIKGVKAINPANKEEIPLFIADYVLGGYGTGAIMAVPAHDERDYAFAKKFNLSIKQVIAPHIVITGEDAPRSEENIVAFDAASGIVEHWDKKAFYVVEFPQGLHGIPGGSVDDNETTRETAMREVKEETGYTDFDEAELVLEHAYSRGYKPRKTREELCHDAIYYIKLRSDKREEIVDVHTQKGSWMTKEEILSDPKFIDHHRFYFEHFLANKPFVKAGTLVNSGEFNGFTSEEAKKKITEAVGGKWVTRFKLRDWLISRQRYWGAPIPVVYDPEGKEHPIPEEHLPWMLPTDVEFKPTGISPLGQSKEFLERTEKIFGKGWKPEVDTMDTFVCSSWYFFRFADPYNEAEFASKETVKHWLPVDLYVGGAEHTVLHLMYARFFTKVLKKFGYVDFNEPFQTLRHQGLILAEDGDKMSKSKGNVVNPDDVSDTYGADTLRLHIMFLGPFEAQKPWSTKNILGVRRFLERIWKLSEKVDATAKADAALETLLHQTIKKVGDDIQNLKMNTAVSGLMILLNAMEKEEQISKEIYKLFLQLLAPFAPHIASELWESAGENSMIYHTIWPVADKGKLANGVTTIAVQVNGKIRATLELSPQTTQEEALEAARGEPNVAKWLALGKETKAVYVAGKIISFATETT